MENKDKILKAALNLFISEGFHGASTSKIAKEAGVSNGTLFHYFSTKEELISKLYLTLKSEYRDYLQAHLDQNKDSKKRIKQFWYSYVQWVLENNDNMTFFTMFCNSPYIDKLSKEEASRNFQFIFELIQEAIDDETLINENPYLIMSTLFASVQAFTSFITNTPDKLEVYKDTAFRMWWRSVVNI